MEKNLFLHKRILQIAVMVLILLLLYIGVRTKSKQQGNTSIEGVTQSFFAMDTYMSITAYGKDAENAVVEAISEIEALEQMLSTGIEMSEVSQINAESGGKLSSATDYLMKRSLELYEITEGAFDITIYPVMKAWGFTDKSFQVPSTETLEQLLGGVDSSQILYDPEKQSVKLKKNAEIDFGGIAKGYTGQTVSEIMKQHGVDSAMINLGGNVALVGYKTDGSEWKIAIQSPNKDGNYLGVITAHDVSVITSGGYERFFEEDGITYHHIIDPKTGYPADNGLKSVTIVCEDGTLADGLSTALYVMGTERAMRFYQENRTLFDCILYTEDGKLYVSEGISNSFSSDISYEVIR